MTDSSPGAAAPVRVPLSLALVFLCGLWTLLTPTLEVGGPLRLLVGGLVTFLLPGYALTVALFPRRREVGGLLASGAPWIATDGDTRLAGIERLVFSVALTLCLVPLVGIVLDSTPWLLDETSILTSVGWTTMVLAVVAAGRWVRVPTEDRFRVAPVDNVLSGVAGAIDSEDELGRLLNVLLVVGFVLASSGIAFAVVTPSSGEEFTEFYLLSTDAETGELVADDYPSEVTLDGSADLTVGLTNQEGRSVEYTVVVLAQTFESENGVRTVQRERTLDRFTLTVEPGESVERVHTIEPAFAAEDIRVSYLLYREPPTGDAPVENAYRRAHFWITVTDQQARLERPVSANVDVPRWAGVSP